MTKLPRIEDCETVEIGKGYNVPVAVCRQTNSLETRRILQRLARRPILGTAHDDTEIIKFPYVHYHRDWRFTTHYQWNYYTRFGRSPLGVVVLKDTVQEIIRMNLKCLRVMPPYPQAGWLAELETVYQKHKLCNIVCPHRGISLKGLEVKDGIVTCPGHGLSWHVATGQLAPRAFH